jgi:tRNA threonylcarbamoyladenosine biosynthesis protein TsaE
MPGTNLQCKDVTELPGIAERILNIYGEEKIFLVSGKMGAGKTTLIKEICQVLGVIDIVNSPTFSIVNEYTTRDGTSVFHFDLYRIKSPAELMDIGYEEYLYNGAVVLIEWPEMARYLMPSRFVMINIEVEESTGIRNITIDIENNY